MTRIAWLIVWLVASFPVIAGASRAPSNAELKQEVDALLNEQRALRKEFDELKTLLQERQAIPTPSLQPIEAVITIGDAPMMGESSAPVTLVEFSDYQCPYCARHSSDHLPVLTREYVDKGRVRYVFVDLPLPMHKAAPKAAEAAHCAGDQGRYWEMHDKLFVEQRALATEQLKGHAAALGLDPASFAECLDGGTHANRVAAGVALAAQLGIRSTPTLLVGRSDGDKVTDVTMIRGVQPVSIYREQIGALLATSPVATAE